MHKLDQTVLNTLFVFFTRSQHWLVDHHWSCIYCACVYLSLLSYTIIGSCDWLFCILIFLNIVWCVSTICTCCMNQTDFVQLADQLPCNKSNAIVSTNCYINKNVFLNRKHLYAKDKYVEVYGQHCYSLKKISSCRSNVIGQSDFKTYNGQNNLACT